MRKAWTSFPSAMFDLLPPPLTILRNDQGLVSFPLVPFLMGHLLFYFNRFLTFKKECVMSFYINALKNWNLRFFFGRPKAGRKKIDRRTGRVQLNCQKLLQTYLVHLMAFFCRPDVLLCQKFSSGGLRPKKFSRGGLWYDWIQLSTCMLISIIF